MLMFYYIVGMLTGILPAFSFGMSVGTRGKR